MKTRVNEICKQRGMSLAELSSRIGIQQSNLTQSLKGNPTIGTLQAIARCLGVRLSDLFEEKEEGVHGYLEVNGEIKKIAGVKDLFPITGTFGIPSYVSYKVCKKDLRSFIKSTGDNRADSFSAVLDGTVLIIVFRNRYVDSEGNDACQFALTSHVSGRKPLSIMFDTVEYWGKDGKVDYEYLVNNMWAEIVGHIDPEKDYETKEEMKRVALD